MSFLVVAILRSGLCYFLSKRGIQVGRLRTMGVHIYPPINIAGSEVLPLNNYLFYYHLGAPHLVHLTGQKMVFAIEKYIDGIRYLDISPKNSGCGYK